MQLSFSGRLEPEWESLIKTFSAMLTLAPEYVVCQAYTNFDIGDSGRYVQTLQEEDGTMTLEAASQRFLPLPLPRESLERLHELGWDEPDDTLDMPNYHMLIQSEDVVPRQVAEFLIITLRDVYGATIHDRYEFAPLQLFVDIVNGEYGEKPGMAFSKFDLEEWRRLHPNPWDD